MRIFSAILFSISANLDNLVIGTSYEDNKKKITLFDNILIAIIGTIGTYSSMIVGKYLAKLLPLKVSNLLGAGVIISMGLYFTMESFWNKNNTNKSSSNSSCNLNIKNTLFLAIGLALNNLGVGVAASATGLSIPLVCLFNFIFSILTIIIGQELSDHIIGKFLGRYSGIISGIALMLLGILECF